MPLPTKERMPSACLQRRRGYQSACRIYSTDVPSRASSAGVLLCIRGQEGFEDCPHRESIRVLKFDAREAQGPCWARHMQVRHLPPPFGSRGAFIPSPIPRRRRCVIVVGWA